MGSSGASRRPDDPPPDRDGPRCPPVITGAEVSLPLWTAAFLMELAEEVGELSPGETDALNDAKARVAATVRALMAAET